MLSSCWSPYLSGGWRALKKPHKAKCQSSACFFPFRCTSILPRVGERLDLGDLPHLISVGSTYTIPHRRMALKMPLFFQQGRKKQVYRIHCSVWNFENLFSIQIQSTLCWHKDMTRVQKLPCFTRVFLWGMLVRYQPFLANSTVQWNNLLSSTCSYPGTGNGSLFSALHRKHVKMYNENIVQSEGYSMSHKAVNMANNRDKYDNHFNMFKTRGLPERP